MRILLSNDDGIHAAGFAALEAVARALSDDVWVCAPEAEQSAASHALTIHRPLRLRQHGEKRFAVDGNPTDCVVLGLRQLLRETKPDLVLSGINHGRNVADDVTYSGTIAVTIEATLRGVPAIALSQAYHRGTPLDWSAAEKWAPVVIAKVMEIGWPPRVLVNVNFPACPADEVRGIAVVRQGRHIDGEDVEERVDPRGRHYFWFAPRGENDDPGEPGSDLHALQDRWVTVTPLHLDLTHEPTLDAFRAAFA
jgi:5'-nucleotidase